MEHYESIKKHVRGDRLEEKDEGRLLQRLKEVTADMREKGIRYQNGRRVFTGYAYAELYDWDLYFENLFLSYMGVSMFCRNGVEMFLDQQHESGFVPRTMGKVYPKPRHHFKPFLAQIALLGCRQSGDYRWLEDSYFQKLKRYEEYWFRHCDADQNGLCFWDGSDHSGMDNQALRLGYDGVMEYEGVDLNCYLVREWWAMAELAAELGNQAEARAFKARGDELARKIDEVFWCEEDGFYYDRSEITGELNRVKAATGFFPMWLGTAPKERVQRLVQEHLLNPEEFWTPYPVATWAKNETGFYPGRKGDECSWMGAAWAPVNYIVFHGLLNYGYKKEAGMLADKTYAMAISEDCTREFYNSITGSGLGLCPFWGWSTLCYVMPLEFDLGYDPTNLEGRDFVRIRELSLFP